MRREATIRPHVVIVGAGFGGLAAAKRLAGSNFDVTVVDRRNHHVFQPLLYQVATAALSPADIAGPIRSIFRKARNIRVILDEVTGVDTLRNGVRLASGNELRYDWLILATGARHSYFGNDEWSAHAPGLKSIDDALAIRRKILLALERAEIERTHTGGQRCSPLSSLELARPAWKWPVR
jgi:NADH dehydrogenase FAD-containing subunit